MKRRSILVASLFVLTTFPMAPSVRSEDRPRPLGGLWKAVVTSGGSSKDYYVEMEEKEGELRGIFISTRSGIYAFKGGKREGDKVRIDVERQLGETKSMYSIDASAAAEGKLQGKLLINGGDSGEVVLTRQGSALAGCWGISAKAGEGQEMKSVLFVYEADGSLRALSISEAGRLDIEKVSFEGDKVSMTLAVNMEGN
jgi:hypothetical protein